ncbi:helix-turn-helix transcriptional regulator [Microcella frigidaquae]|uniref:Proteasome accessory factor C n=1 Tax=Microcella frigidaquae TaxID=424758 RepID=A0A840X2T8_9MICO|nr:WYL domain-containing protein [Microcella frigidaquae]MBB5616793.1 proteasome accessory factor C [Microcella frigidaquae]NHN43766.1 WYL domain-containing protein [Microcella frigidaquae]
MAERAAALGAPDKLAFLLSLVPYLIDQVRVTVAEAAEHFGTTPEQMRKAVTLIAMSGTPGADGTYTHETLFDIDWDNFEERDIIRFRAAPMEERPRFSAREAAALLAGLQRVAALPAFAARVDILELMAKLARGATDAPAALAVRPGAQPGIHGILVDAVAAGRRVRIDYVTTRGERQVREVDPIRVEGVDDAWYLRGWCLTRDAERTFLLDRVASVDVLGSAESHISETADDALFQGDADDELVELALPVTALPLLADYRGADDPVRIEGDRAIVSLRIAHPGILGRVAARVAGAVEILGPPSARSAVLDWARAAIAAQGADPA